MSSLCLKLPGRRRHRSTWSPPSQRTKSRTSTNDNRGYVVGRENMPVGMEVTEDTPPDMLTGSMNLKLVLPSGKKIKTSVERSTPMMDLLVHVTTCHKLSPAAHVLQPYGERGVLPYKPSTPIGALDTVMVHVIPKNQLTQNQSNKMALKQVSQPFEQTYRIQVSLPRNQLYVLRANGRTTIADIHSEICEEKDLDPTKYSLRHPKELGTELKGEMTIAEYKSNQLVLVSNRSNPANQFSTDDIINAIQNINNNNNNNIYAFEPSSRSLSPDSSMSPVPVQEPLKPLRKKKPPAPPPPNNKKVSREKNDKGAVGESGTGGPGRVICHSRTSSDSSGYHEASLLSESPPSNNSSLPDSLPRRSKLELKLKSSRDQLSPAAPGSGTAVQQNQALSKSLIDLKAHHAESSASSSNAQQHSSLKPAQSTTSLHTARKKRAAPLPPPSAPPPMKTVLEERLNGNSETGSENAELTPTERSRTLEAERKPPLEPVEKCRTLPPGLTMSSAVDKQSRDHVETPEHSQPIPDVEIPLAPPDERDLVMEDEEIDRIFNNATAEHGNSMAQRSPLVEGNDSGRDSTDSNEVRKPLGIVQMKIDKVDETPKIPHVLPSPVKSVSDETIDWEYQLPAPPTFRDPPESPEIGKKSDDPINLTPRSAVMSELSTIISQRSSSVLKLNEEIPPPLVNEEIETTSTLDNFKITTYTKNTRSSNINSNVSVRRNNSVKESVMNNNDRGFSDQAANPTVKRSVSHVSLFVRPFDNSRSKTLDRNQDKQIGSSIGLRKTTSEFNIDSVGRRQERPQSFVEPQSLQSLQVLRSILPQLSRSQGSLNTIVETEPPTVKPPPEPVVAEKPTPRYEREEKVAVSLSTWVERPKRQVSIKSDRDYVFGQGGVAVGKRMSSTENLQLQDSSSTNVTPSLTKASFVTPIQKGNITPVQEITRQDSVKLIPEETRIESNMNTEDVQSDDDKKPKRITNVYKSLDTGNTKPLRHILNDVSRIPVVRSVELKAPYKQDWPARNTGLDKLKERFESDKNTKETSPIKENDSFESTGKIRERFETAIKERYESTEKMFGRRDHIDSNAFKTREMSTIENSTFKQRETTKININPEMNKPDSNQHKYESKVKIDGNQTYVSSNNKSETKIELSDGKTPLTNRYTSVIGIGGSDCEVRVRVKTSTGRSSMITAPPPDPRQQLLTSIRGFGGLDSLKKVRS